LKKDIHDRVVFIRQTFNDLEQLNVAAKKWKLDFRQLDTGRLEGEVMILDSAQVQLGTVNFNRHLEQRGITPGGYRTFAIPADHKQYFNWREHQIKGNNLMIFPSSGEIDAVSYPGFQVFTISLRDGILKELLGNQQDQASVLYKGNAEVFELSAHSMSIIRQSVSYLFSKVKINPEIIEKAAFKRLLFKDFPSNLINSLHLQIPKSKNSTTRIRDISLNKAIKYLNTCTTDFPNVKELCLISGASQRTLEYAFKAKFGITPQNYIKKLRLNRVREVLKYADPGKNTVNEIAYKLGFWHLGQFAIDYKKVFEESPLKTLKTRVG